MHRFVRQIVWEEPNRRNTPPLHIAQHGERYSTVTGVWWLDDRRFLANHRSGLRLALFDLESGDEPLAICEIPHLTDTVSAKPVRPGEWEVAVSGCWDAEFSLFRLTMDPEPRMELLDTRLNRIESFCHGIGYDPAGDLWLTFHTGAEPRIEVADSYRRVRKPWAKDRLWKIPTSGLRLRSWQLPSPWGARHVCFDADGTGYAVAVSANPRKESYATADTTLWTLSPGGRAWSLVHTISGAHSDACAMRDGVLWLPDQLNDRALGFDLRAGAVSEVIAHETMSFPHGLHLSPSGRIAVTHYGNSSITVFDPA